MLGGISLAVEEGEVLVLLGRSGSGKTTLLRLIAGFERPDSGSLLLEGDEVGSLAPARRNFGMVFQHYALFPHLTVGENVAFGLESRHRPRAEVERRVAEMLALVDLAGFEHRRVHQISGGQQQRVALARALAPAPRVLLLDEPLSNLDPTLRERTRRQLRRSIRQVGITAVWVTHEQEEAFDVGDRVAVLEAGRLEQVGTPEELYLEPASRFVAGFVGRASALAGVLVAPDRARVGETAEAGRVEWSGVAVGALAPGDAIDIVARPEGLDLLPADAPGALAGVVGERRYAGETTYYRVDLDRGGSVLVAAAVAAGRVGDRAAVAPRPGGPLPRFFPSESGVER